MIVPAARSSQTTTTAVVFQNLLLPTASTTCATHSGRLCHESPDDPSPRRSGPPTSRWRVYRRRRPAARAWAATRRARRTATRRTTRRGSPARRRARSPDRQTRNSLLRRAKQRRTPGTQALRGGSVVDLVAERRIIEARRDVRPERPLKREGANLVRLHVRTAPRTAAVGQVDGRSALPTACRRRCPAIRTDARRTSRPCSTGTGCRTARRVRERISADLAGGTKPIPGYSGAV